MDNEQDGFSPQAARVAPVVNAVVLSAMTGRRSNGQADVPYGGHKPSFRQVRPMSASIHIGHHISQFAGSAGPSPLSKRKLYLGKRRQVANKV